MTAASWFLVFAIAQQWIGPLPEASCHMAAATLRSEGVECRQASGLRMCNAMGYPEGSVYMSCPVFDFPKVMVKP